MGKHTPGPWGYTSRKGSWDWVVYCNADPNIEICQPFHDGTDLNQIGEANARLISAAPDMLKALEACLSALSTMTDPGAIKTSSVQNAWAQAVEASVRARAAISKATGGAS